MDNFSQNLPNTCTAPVQGVLAKEAILFGDDISTG